ncbi:MAG: hypothetical protein ABI852_09915 [Gemmatimonadaceae bacterium]
MRAAFVTCIAVLVAGCASSSAKSSMGSGGAVTTQTVQGTMANVAVSIPNTVTSNRLDVALPMDVAWAKLQAAYTTLGVKVTMLDQASHTIGNPGLRARRRIGDVALVKAINCGGESSAPNAETYDMTLTFQSRLEPAPGGVVVETLIRGTGQNPLTNNTNTVQCYSMGELEKRIVALMTAK